MLVSQAVVEVSNKFGEKHTGNDNYGRQNFVLKVAQIIWHKSDSIQVAQIIGKLEHNKPGANITFGVAGFEL